MERETELLARSRDERLECEDREDRSKKMFPEEYDFFFVIRHDRLRITVDSFTSGQVRMLLFERRIRRMRGRAIGSSISRVKRDGRYPVTELSLSDVAGVPYEE